MQTKNYTDDLLPLIGAICGVDFAAIELPRINALVNSRAKRAYRASAYWPRFLVVGESRVATSGVIPFTEGSLGPIDTFIHINRTQPYQTATAQLIEYDVTGSGATLTDGNLNLSAAFVTYKKQLADTYGDGSSGTTVLVPDEWFEYIAHGVYSDFLRAEGQQEKAALADQEAQEKLAEEMTTDNFIHTINKVSNQRIHTHGNSTTRW